MNESKTPRTDTEQVAIKPSGEMFLTWTARGWDFARTLELELVEANKINRWQQESLTAFRDKFGVPSNCQALDAIDSLRAELLKWKEGCLANAEDARDAHEKSDKRRLELLKVKAECAGMKAELQKLACLGNGDRPGNSVGNEIAQRALESSTSGDELLRELNELRRLFGISNAASYDQAIAAKEGK